ncbi:MAG: hypothetical protein WDA08_04660 [Weeksellaceae bacterium]
MSSILKIKTICIIFIFGLIKSCVFTYKNEDSLVGNVYFSENIATLTATQVKMIAYSAEAVFHGISQGVITGISGGNFWHDIGHSGDIDPTVQEKTSRFLPMRKFTKNHHYACSSCV